MSGNIFDCHDSSAIDIYWVEAREAVEYPTMPTQAPVFSPTKNNQVKNVSGAKELVKML